MGILKGLIFAVGMTLVMMMRKLSCPQDSVLGVLPGSGTFVDVARHPEAKQIPHLLVFRPNGMLFFANANRIRNHVHELISSAEVPLRAVVINLETSPEIDLTSLEMLDQLRSELEGVGIALYFARVADRVRDLFGRSRLTERIGPNRLFLGVDLAVNAFLKDDAVSEKVRAENLNQTHV
jgi:MFS superfamily sulfate permease-like transporter